jgi:hypothetical protein
MRVCEVASSHLTIHWYLESRSDQHHGFLYRQESVAAFEILSRDLGMTGERYVTDSAGLRRDCTRH